MSKKDDDLDLDLDSMGLDEYDEPPISKDKSRTPIMESARAARKGALNAVWGRGKRTKVILDGMPDVASSAHQGYTQTADVVSTLLSHTKDEVVKTEKLLKTQTRQLLPTLRKYLPDSVTKRISNWSRNDDGGYGNYDPVQAAIDRMNDEVFNRRDQPQNATAEQESVQERRKRQKEAADELAEGKIKSAIDSMRMDQLLRTTDGMARDVRTHTDLATGPMLQAQRRSLELQYRQLFAIQDLIKIQQTSLDRTVPGIEAIVKNTALPDYAKESLGEIHSAQFKRKVMSWVNPGQYADRFLDNIKERGVKKIGQVGDELRSLMSTVMESSIEDDYDLDDQSGMSPDRQKTNLRDKGIELGSGWLARKLLGPQIAKLQKRSKEYLSDKPQAMGFLHKTAYNLNNLSSISNSSLAGERDGGLASFFNALRMLGIVDPYNRENISLETRDRESLSRASKFDQRTWLTINETIPAWFSRLNRSIMSLAGRDVDEVYDVTTRGFVESKKLANRIRGAVAGDQQRLRMQTTVNETVDFLDKKKALTAEERTRLGSFIEQRASLGREFNVEQLLKDPYVLQQALGHKGSEKVAAMLREHSNSENGGTYRLSNEMTRRIADIQAIIRPRQDLVDDAAYIHGEKLLRDAGLFHYNEGDNSFGVDKDLVDPYTLFNSIDVGKSRTGRARTRQQEIARKLANGSASAKWLKRRYNQDGTQIESYVSDTAAVPPAEGFFGKLRHPRGRPAKSGGMSREELREVLFGGQRTDFTELLQPLRKNEFGGGVGSRSLEEAVRANNHNDVLQQILTHVKSIDENGMRFAADGDDELVGPPNPNGKKTKRKRRGITATSIFGQWWQLLGNTAESGAGLIGKGFGALNRGRKSAFDWIGKKFGGPGPGMISRLGTGIGGLWSGASTFVKSTIGFRDIYGADGKVVLSANKLKNGEYFQYKGVKLVPLTKLEDINYKASIVDAAGRVVVSPEELKAHGALSYYKGGRWHSLWQAIGGKAGDTINSAFGKANSARQWLGEKGSNVIKSVKDWAVSYPDIYVKGETTPRLKGRLLKAGSYFVKGKAIYDPKEIVDVVTDADGREIIGLEEITNPKFELVDGWGRPIGTPLGRVRARLGKMVGFGLSLPGHAMRFGRTAFEKIAGYAKDNPLTRWWNKDRKPGNGWFNNWFSNNGSKQSKSTDSILIRIYKLLNARMQGEPEDEAWTEEFLKDGPRSASAASQRRMRRLKAAARKKWSERWGRATARGRGWYERAAGKFNTGWGWTRHKGETIGRNASEMAEEIIDPFRSSRHDIGDRYNALKSLYGRDDDVADFYRSRINRRGKLSKAKIMTAAEDTAMNAANAVKGKAKSVWGSMSEKLSKLVDLQEMSWFNTMRSSVTEAGAGEGFLRTMYSKWAKRNPMKNDASERKDYFQFWRRKGKKEGEEETKGTGTPGKGGKATSIFGGLLESLGIVGKIIGGIASPILSILKFAGKWGILKPAGLLLRAGAGVVGGIAGTALSAAGAVVAAVGWPVTLGVAAVAGLTYLGYKMSQYREAKFLDKLRLAQYGFRDYDEWSSDDGAKALYLEDNLKKYVTFDEKDNAVMRGLSPAQVEQLTAGFGIDKENQTETMAFHAFMLQRFIPIYLRWYSAVRQNGGNVALGELGRADKVSREDMLSILSKVKLTKDAKVLQAVQDPRKADQGLFSRMWDTVTFTEPDLLPPAEVMEVQDEVEKEIKDRKDIKGRSKNSSYFRTHSKTDDTQVATGVAESMASLAAIDKENYANEDPNGATRAMDAITVQVDVDVVPAAKDLDALQSIRMKSYGLKTLEQAKVRQLLAFEAKVLPKLNLNNSTFEGDWAELMEGLVPGCTKTENGKARARYWFEGRFLPVFMTYVMGVKRYAPAANPLNLTFTGGYLYEVGLLISRAYSYRNDFRQSVWAVQLNPFGEAVNDDPSSIDREMETLKQLSKQADMAVRNMLKEGKGDNELNKYKTLKWGNSGDRQKQEYKQDYNGIKDYSKQATDTRVRQHLSVLEGSEPGGDYANRQGGSFRDYVNNTMGISTITLGEGGEGNYRSLAQKYPIESLNDPKQVQKLVAEAAKIVGVPEGVALAMCQAESRFNYRAQPRTKSGRLLSSAKGLFQFLDGTWSGSKGAKGEMQLYGNKFGVPAGTTAFDPYASALLGANFIRNNIKSAERDYGGKVPQGVAYLYHFLGAGDAGRFMKAYRENPQALCTSVKFKSSGAISANRSVFFDGDRPRTLAGVMGELQRRMGGSMAALANTPGMTDSTKLFEGLNGSEPVDMEVVSKPTSNRPAANDASVAANDDAGTAAAPSAPPSNIPMGSDPAGAASTTSPSSQPMPNTPVVTTRIPDPASDPQSKGPVMPKGAGLDDLLGVEQSQDETLTKILDVLNKILNKGGAGFSNAANTAPATGAPRPPAQTFTQPKPVLNVARGG